MLEAQVSDFYESQSLPFQEQVTCKDDCASIFLAVENYCLAFPFVITITPLALIFAIAVYNKSRNVLRDRKLRHQRMQLERIWLIDNNRVK